MSTKLSFVILFVCVLAMQFGLLASVPLADAVLPWIAVVALVSVCWPIVAGVLGLFGVLLFDKKGKVDVDFDLSKPGHKIGYLVWVAGGRCVRAARTGMSSVFHKVGQWTEPKASAARKIRVNVVAGKKD